MAEAAHAGLKTRRTARRFRLPLIALACLTSMALGESPKTIDLPTFQAQLAAAAARVQACGAARAECQPEGLPQAEQVARVGGAPAFAMEWDWLRNALDSVQTASTAQRTAAMTAAAAQLAEIAREAGTAPVAGPSFSAARNAVRGVLAQPEFQAAAGPSWLDRQIAKVQDWFFRLLMGMDRIGSRNPWLAAAMEWTCFLLAAGGLVFFVRRSLARGALRIALGDNAALGAGGDHDAPAWARLAEEHAATGAWREGVHCLYWAAVVSLERRRAWKPNPTRTPREHLRLLRPGSDAHRALLGLTQTFERVWYGHDQATEAEFRNAQGALAAVKAADLRRDEAAPRQTTAEVTR